MDLLDGQKVLCLFCIQMVFEFPKNPFDAKTNAWHITYGIILNLLDLLARKKTLRGFRTN
jgi:hypothetical protein